MCTAGVLVAFLANMASGQNGKQWVEYHPEPTGHVLTDIHAIDTVHAVISGGYGTILTTDNGGSRWQKAKVQKRINYLGLHTVGDDTIWAVGERGSIVRTTDRGKSWSVQESGTDQRLTDVHFINHRKGWAIGQNGTVLYTDDGGISWQSRHLKSSRWLTAVYFTSSDHGWIVGENRTVLKYSRKSPTEWSSGVE